MPWSKHLRPIDSDRESVCPWTPNFRQQLLRGCHVGIETDTEPFLDRACQVDVAVCTNRLVAERVCHRHITAPDHREIPYRRIDIQIHFLARILGAQIDLVLAGNQPPRPEAFQLIKLEAQHGFAVRQPVGLQASLQVPHQEFNVELGIGHLAACPAHTPDRKLLDHGFEFPSAGRELILVTFRARWAFAYDEALFFEHLQALAQQRR